MEKLFGNDPHVQPLLGGGRRQARYIDAMRSGRTSNRKITSQRDVKTALLLRRDPPGPAVYEVTAGGRPVPLRFTATGRRGRGARFVSWQSTVLPNQ